MIPNECGVAAEIETELNVCLTICCLPPGHPGPHWDQVEGWEW